MPQDGGDASASSSPRHRMRACSFGHLHVHVGRCSSLSAPGPPQTFDARAAACSCTYTDGWSSREARKTFSASTLNSKLWKVLSPSMRGTPTHLWRQEAVPLSRRRRSVEDTDKEIPWKPATQPPLSPCQWRASADNVSVHLKASLRCASSP